MTNARGANLQGVSRPSRRRGSILTLREQMLKDEQQRLAVASRIRELRGPVPQPVIAEKVGVGLRGYQKWEQTGGISWENLQKLAKIHKVEADWILNGEGKGATPDLMGTVNGGGDTDLGALRQQLDRIEQNQTDLAALLDAISAQVEAIHEQFAPTSEAEPRAQRSRSRRRLA